MTKAMRVCIIGAGAAGLAAIRHCSSSKEFTCVAYEQTDKIGGTWQYTDEIEIDKNGLPVHTSMYENLVTNLPKETMEFPDFPFKKCNRSYLKQEEVLDYLKSYTNHFGLEQHVKFHHKVTQVNHIENNCWNVTVRDLKTQVETDEEFDAILVCNGHFSKPNMPSIEGSEKFKGSQIHSHHYRKASKYRNQKVLVVGAGPSAIDIATNLTKEASKVILYYRGSTKSGLDDLKGMTIKNGTLKLTEAGACINDSPNEQLDAIIYGTGYHYSFPFLNDSCGIRVENNHVQPLYRHFINIEHSTMALIGLPFGVLPFLLFDYQIRMFLKCISGEVQLPSKENMLDDSQRDLEVRIAKGYPRKHAHKLGVEFQADYFDAIARESRIERVPPVKMKLYNNTSMKRLRHLLFEVLDEDNYKTSLASADCNL